MSFSKSTIRASTSDRTSTILFCSNALGTIINVSPNEPFETDEIVSVLFTYLSADSQPVVNLNVDEYEAGTNITFTDNPITNKVTISATQPDLTNYATISDINTRIGIPVEKVNSLTSSSTITIDPAEGSLFNLTLDTDTTITLANITNNYYTNNGAVITLFMPAHSYIVNWSNNVVWASGSAPDLSTGVINIITFATSDNGVTWYGNTLNVRS